MRLEKLTRPLTLPRIFGVLGVVLLGAAAWFGAADWSAPIRPHPVILVTRLSSTATVARPVSTPVAQSSSSGPDQAATPGASGLVSGLPYVPDNAQSATTPAGPRHLLIPSIGLVETVLTIPVVNGNWDVSQLDTHIGWLSTTGSRPGDALAMAFIGHYTISAARKGALADLWHTQLDDQVIYESGGVDYVYAIKSMQTVGPSEVKKLYVNDGRQILLVTCANWDYLEFRYTNRLIVQAELVRQERSQ
jgi:LPXTG-site transpeptidase (sortase) family protein